MRCLDVSTGILRLRVPAVSLHRPGASMPVETKLHAPTARKEWVERDDLVGYLTGTAARLVLLSAPAGSGKTTVVAQWRSSPAEARAFAWISLDHGRQSSGPVLVACGARAEASLPGT